MIQHTDIKKKHYAALEVQRKGYAVIEAAIHALERSYIGSDGPTLQPEDYETLNRVIGYYHLELNGE